MNSQLDPILFNLFPSRRSWHLRSTIKYYLPIKNDINYTTNLQSEVQREVIIVLVDRFLVPRDLALHTALYIAIRTCVRLFMHLPIRGIIRVMIVRLYCRVLFEIRMHGYLDRTRWIQGSLGPFYIREYGATYWWFGIPLCAHPETIWPALSGIKDKGG